MKKFSFLVAAIMMISTMEAADRLDLKGITSGEFSAKYVTGINPIEGTDLYASVSQDGTQIISYSFKTGKEVSILFDIHESKAPFEAIDGYVMSPDGKQMLLITNRQAVYRRSFKAEYFIYNIAGKTLKKLSEGINQQVATWSPDSKRIAFVKDNNLFVYDGTKESQITHDGKFNEVINGIPDWVYEEEFSFNRAFAWNANGTSIGWIRFDESHVKTYSLQLFEGAEPKRTEFHDYPGEYSYKYPKAGQDNSKVSLWSYDLKTGKTIRLNVPVDADGYYPRIKTSPDANSLIVYTMNRHQDDMRLYSVNPFTGTSKMLIQESVPKFVKEEVVENSIVGKQNILLPSDRDGYMHLYLYDMNGKLQRQVEKGNYDVTDIYGMNEQTGDVYFQAAMLNAHDRQVYVAHKNGKVERLTDACGANAACFSGDYKYFVNTWSSYSHPQVFTVRNNKGKVIKLLEDNKQLLEKTQKYNWGKRETFSFTTSEGVKLDGWMVKPLDFDANKKYPVILFQYSGPGNQQVLDSWNTGSMGQGGAFDYYLAQEGFIVACVDGRGTGARGVDFEKCTYLRLGDLESKDQVETALYMGALPYVDKNNIGIWGWSYGGFNTLMSMSEGRPVFKAGVAVAPPTCYRFYDTVYTERYMRTPQENDDGYKINPIERANQLHGALLICHGVADDNVHPQNTFEYSEALVQADKDFKELFYTNRNHSIFGGNTRNHLLRQIATWFKEHLKNNKIKE